MILTGLTFLLVNAQETSKNVNDSKTAKNAKIVALLFFFLKENVLVLQNFPLGLSKSYIIKEKFVEGGIGR